ncbi:(-)-delta-cadinene synthase [Cladorrhinum sp. PSN259]|nr:(-)-delta-cadinene synthase [Cladorrhinum sp. PSN259]
MEPNTKHNRTKESLLGQLKGQTLHIPALRPLFSSAWRTSLEAVNPNREQLKFFMSEKLATLIEDRKVLEGMKKGDAGLWVTGLFPSANYETLCLFATYTIFLFLWDDAIDGSDCVTLEDAERYCTESVEFIEYHLLGGNCNATGEPVAPTKACELFAEVARGVKEHVKDENESRVLFRHVKEYINACLVEYRWRTGAVDDKSKETMPTIKDFWGWRLGTSSVDVMLDFERVLNGIEVSKGLRESEEMRGMERVVNRGFVIINELFSLKKELRDGALGNLVPVTMHELGVDLDGATKKVVQELDECLKDFDKKAVALQMKAEDEGIRGMVRRLTEAYRAIITGTLNFSIDSPRYGVLKDQKEDGSFEVEL